jgi:pimeloyl-ACP methyl ester carboxylesterase
MYRVMRSVTTADGRTLTAREAGDLRGVPLLYMAGTPGSSMLYEPHIRDAARQGIRLISYDRPGYGGSSRRQARRVADCVADVTAVCDALGIQRCCVAGISGGGPHALAAAALLPERIAAGAVLACVAPFDGEGLDFYADMGEQNIEEFRAAVEGEDSLRAVVGRQRTELLASKPRQLVEVWQTLLGPADREVATSAFASFALEHIRAGIGSSADGWLDDDVAFVTGWGFDVSSIRVPVLVWQGQQDRFVPYGHGVWLAEHIPGVDARLTSDDGHMTLAQRRLPAVHSWLRNQL